MSKASSTAGDNLVKEVGLALKGAAKEARRLAKMHGTKVWCVRDGRIVGEKP